MKMIYFLMHEQGVSLDDIESDMEDDMQEGLPSYSVPQNGGNNQRLETESEWHAFERQQKVLENAQQNKPCDQTMFLS